MASICYKNEKKHTKETPVHIFTPKKINFLDETVHLIKISYND